MHKCFFLLGSNLGNRSVMMENALEGIRNRIGVVIRKSSIYQSEPWGFDSSETFLNLVAEVNTEKKPLEILSIIHQIEIEAGRVRNQGPRYQSRQLDIDILFYDDDIISEANLTVPHPRLHLRKFTLEPLNEIAPDMMHPLLKKSISELLCDCPDQLMVKKTIENERINL
jgi:2-amino-4-hydroxy-6-hydroxymethyldihydropteridine diphosphokinase